MSVAAAPADAVVFSHTAEGFFVRGLGAQLTPALKAELKPLGFDFDRPLLPAYGVRAWNEALFVVRRHVYPDESDPRGIWLLGERMIAGYNETMVGKAVLSMARLIGPRRTVLRTRKNWRSGNNYTEVEVTELTPSDFRLELNEPGAARWVSQGLLSAGLRFAGAKGLSVDVEAFTDETVVYRTKWT